MLFLPSYRHLQADKRRLEGGAMQSGSVAKLNQWTPVADPWVEQAVPSDPTSRKHEFAIVAALESIDVSFDSDGRCTCGYRDGTKRVDEAG